MSNYCTKCGTRLVDDICPRCTATENVSPVKNKYQEIFVDSKEQFVTALGNTYAEKFLLNGTVDKGFAIVSNKRAYFQGTTYEIVHSGGKKNIQKTQRSRVIDLKNITGTGYDSIENEFYKWARFTALIPFILCILISFATA